MVGPGCFDKRPGTGVPIRRTRVFGRRLQARSDNTYPGNFEKGIPVPFFSGSAGLVSCHAIDTRLYDLPKRNNEEFEPKSRDGRLAGTQPGARIEPTTLFTGNSGP